MEGVLGVVRKENLFLLGEEAKDCPIKGEWRLLGGHLKDGEEPFGALEREVEEEAGIKIEVEEFLCTIPGDYVDIELRVCAARWLGGELRPNKKEVSRVAWVHPKDFANYNMNQLSQRQIEAYLARG